MRRSDLPSSCLVRQGLATLLENREEESGAAVPESVPMPEGSSSEPPVMKPGPRIERKGHREASDRWLRWGRVIEFSVSAWTYVWWIS